MCLRAPRQRSPAFRYPLEVSISRELHSFESSCGIGIRGYLGMRPFLLSLEGALHGIMPDVPVLFCGTAHRMTRHLHGMMPPRRARSIRR